MSKLRRWTSEGGTPIEKPVRPTREGSAQLYTPEVRCGCQFFQCDSLLPERVNPVGTRPTSRASNIISYESDHEYEIIEKPPPNIIYTAPSVDEKPKMIKTDDELSSTTSLERKYLQHTSDEDEQMDEKENFPDENIDGIVNAETLQKDIEDRYFANTPSSVSRTECEISTSQVDSSALENLPLKRDSRSKKENIDNRMQQRIKAGTSKIKSQAGKIKTKLQNIKTPKFIMPERPKFTMPERPKINFPERPKFKMPERSKISLPERPKFTLPERPKFTLPDRRKFSLPDRPKLRKINITEKLNLGDRKKFSFPERSKFNVPEFPKFKMPERPKINFPSLGRKKEYKVENDVTETSDDFHNVATVDFEAKTYPRLFNRKKKSELQKTSSSPTLNREDTPPATFTFTRVNKPKDGTTYIPDSPEQPREYGNVDNDVNFETEVEPQRDYEIDYSFNKEDSKYLQNEPESYNDNHNGSISDFSPSNQEYTHVINEIDNDEFFVRPRGISRENIQVREYLSDEIRQAFKIPKNVLAMMGSNTGVNDENMYINEPEADPELMDENDQMRYSTEDLNERDDGYYTFPPVRPSRAKRKKKQPETEPEPIPYIDDSVNASMQFSEVDLDLADEHPDEQHINEEINGNLGTMELNNRLDFTPATDLHSIHEYANDDVIEYPENTPIQSQTLPMPPKRKKKFTKQDFMHSSLNDFKDLSSAALWEEPKKQQDDIIVYRTEHEYIVPQELNTVTEQSPVAPRRNRSRSSRCTSICDDDRTSHGAESLTLDTHVPQSEDIEIEREVRHESPGYATVDKSAYAPSKAVRRSKSKTPPVRRKKSNSSERKYYTVGCTKTVIPDRPPRKKSSTSLMTLESFKKRSLSTDLTQYVEIDEPQPLEEIHKDLISGEVVSKMKDRPLPPPPRPPRGPKRKKKDKDESGVDTEFFTELSQPCYVGVESKFEDVIEIEVSTQTDPLPDDVDFELGMDENLDVSMSSSLKDFVDEDSVIGKYQSKHAESPRVSRPTSRSEKSLKISDPKISELSNIGRTSPTVILVERRVSSPTRINERDEMLTEASLTVQHIDLDESQIPDVPPLPRARSTPTTYQSPRHITQISEERALERVGDSNREIQLDNLVTQRLQVKDLDVGRLNVSELQASKILVSDIEGMTLQVAELDSKSGHISVSGIEFSQTVIDEIVKKFAEISTNQTLQPSQVFERTEHPRTVIREEQTQTDEPSETKTDEKILTQVQPEVKPETKTVHINEVTQSPLSPPRPASADESVAPPQRPPPPDLTPLLYSYLQDIAIPSSSYFPPRSFRDRPYPEYHDSQYPQSPPPPTRRVKRKPAAPHTESSTDEDRPCPSPRRVPPAVRTHEPTITEAGVQFLRVCQNSVSRTIRNIFNSLMAYINRTEDKKDVQMALVIFLVLVAGLLMFGLSDSRAIHHHHWEFFNPPDGKQ
ncbi:uncharacterized protein LOC131852974 isoform X2 [Achroia grisella]|uniref:uncharacterized protein LOC131852974 isoform X2 n=1 Tax=Achroia grisella TaxID=688607 RepID=UPI0027D27146|nr:uncharacterized protein LOC131852974 isoform X2 [Achroia grisella]